MGEVARLRDAGVVKAARARMGNPVPPHDIDGEVSLLALVLDPPRAPRARPGEEQQPDPNPLPALRRILSDDGSDFYDPQNASTWRAAVEVADRSGGHVEPALVRDLLLARGAADHALDDFFRRVLSTPTIARRAHLVATHVRELAGRRRMIERLHVLTAEAYEREVGDHNTWLAGLQADLTRVAREASTEQAAPTLGETALASYVEAKREGAEHVVPGIWTGLAPLDERMSGGTAGLTIVLAPRGGGKTALAVTLIANLSESDDGAVVPFFSFEMPKEQIGDRLLSCVAQVDGRRLRERWRLNADDWRRLTSATERVTRAKGPIWDDKSKARLGWIRATLRAYVLEQREAKRRVRAAVIDSLQVIRARAEMGPGDWNRDQELGFIVRELKAVADELGVAIILLSRANKGGTVRESGDAEYDADNVWRITHAKDAERFGDVERWTSTITITKQRAGVGKVSAGLWFWPAHSRYEG